MQTWAKRGMRAALVTGGVLAVGAGNIASAEDNSDQPTLGDGQLTWDEVRNAGGPFTTPHTDSTVMRMSGNIDSERDLLPAVENEHTREIPALIDEPSPRGETTARKPRHQLRTADTSAAHRERTPGQAARQPGPRHELQQHTALADSVEQLGQAGDPGRSGRRDATGPVRAGTPSEGFHRSLSWTGPVGGVVHGQNGVPAGARADNTARTWQLDMAEPLITPGEDLVYADGFDRSDRVNQWATAARERTIGLGGVVDSPTTELPAVPYASPTARDATGHDVTGHDATASRARPAVDRSVPSTAPSSSGLPSSGLPSGGLLSPVTADLTAANLSRSTKLHPVPHRVVNQALAASAPVSFGQDSDPLQVPGEYQDRVDEVPSLRGLTAAARRSVLAQQASPLRSASSAPEQSDTEVTTPFLRPIETALNGVDQAEWAASPVRFSPVPQRSDVSVRTLDELTAGMPERDWATRNPFPVKRNLPAMPRLGMALPGLGDGHRTDTLATPGVRV